jgi:hypothetical protein
MPAQMTPVMAMAGTTLTAWLNVAQFGQKDDPVLERLSVPQPLGQRKRVGGGVNPLQPSVF